MRQNPDRTTYMYSVHKDINGLELQELQELERQ